MSKIVQAVNVMISNPQLINKVVKGGDELFFLYKNKYIWSMAKGEDSDDGHFLWYYPEAATLEEISSTKGSSWQNVTVVTYRDLEIGTREAKASFAELYTLLNEKLYGIDAMFKDILSELDDDLPF